MCLIEKDKNQQGQIINTTTLDLGEGQTYNFGLNVQDREMFSDKEKSSKKALRTKATRLQTDLSNQLKEGVDFAERRTTETAIFRNESARLCKDSVWFRFSDSPEMKRVKLTVNFLNNLLDSNLSKYASDMAGQKIFDIAAIKHDIDTAFEEAHSACEAYLAKKEKDGKAKKKHGIRRKKKVLNMRNMIEVEKLKYDSLIEAMKMGSLKDYSVEKAMNKSPRDLSSTFKSSVVKDVDVEWQNQGNSTDVYRVVIKEDGKEKIYYLKRNLPLISADIGAFLDRRTKQLLKSKERRNSDVQAEKDKEEHRMKKAGMKDGDYDNAIKFLKALKKKENGASAADRDKVLNRIINLFCHDFDRMFTELKSYNTAVQYAMDNGDVDWEKKAANPNDPLHTTAQFILAMRKEKGGAEDNGEKLEPKDALTWVEEKLGLDTKADADIIRALKEIHESDKAHGLENLFRVSLGKEVELFGQMRDRGKGDEREQAAANNTGTYKIAEMAGLTDVVTASDIRIVRFKDRDDNIVEDFCTVTEAAEGIEFIDLIKKAEKDGKRIDYEPEAVRKLMRLQMLDTITRQVDRHGRNFKCEITEKEDSIVVRNIMSYDHDMSFAEESLENTFKVKEDGSVDFQGFLPPMTTKISKNSAFFQYLRYDRFKMLPKIMSEAEEPKFRHHQYESNTKRINVGDERSFLYPLLYERQFASPEMQISVGDDKREMHGKVYRIPKDEAELKEFKALMEENRYLPREEADKFSLTGEELNKVTNELGKIISNIQKLVLRGSSKKDNEERKKIQEEYKKTHELGMGKAPKYLTEFKTEYTDAEKKRLCEEISELKRMYDTYDFRCVSAGDKLGSYQMGKLDLWMQQFIYFFVNAFKEDTVVIEKFLDIEKKKEEVQEKEELFKKLQDENGDIVLPTFLHFDNEAYEGIKAIANDKNLDAMNLNLKALDFNDKKIQMNQQRAKEMLKEIEEARKKALIFYQLMGWTTEPQNKFLLDKDDYSKFNNIEELAVDPGKTYLSIDNKNYIYGVNGYAKHANINEFINAYEAEKKKRQDPKRWDDKGFGYNIADDEGEKMKDRMKENALRGNIVSGN